MARYRKKPVIVEAEQFGGFYATPYPTGVMMQDNTRNPEQEKEHGRYAFYVVTAHGQRVYLKDGDWIIAEPDGRGYYPCKPDIFAATYEPADHPLKRACSIEDVIDAPVVDPLTPPDDKGEGI